MHFVALIAGLMCCGSVALDAFQTIILPRRPSGRIRITSLFGGATWFPLRAMADRVRDAKMREQLYSIYGPLSLLMLLGLWAVLLITGFALFYFSMGSPYADLLGHPDWLGRFSTDLYVSGTTLFTLGLGDVVPRTMPVRALIVMESGVGLGLVALVIGYLPVLYQAFSRREVSVALLDARGGSPPTATELLRRHAFDGGQEAMVTLLEEWERWSAEILESHISYPILCYYRSQHDNQSWLSALVSILDSCALLISLVEGKPARQAQLTFAIGRHALIDLGHVFHLEEATKRRASSAECMDRLPRAEFDQLCLVLGELSLKMCGDSDGGKRLLALRELYEPQAWALSEYLRMPMPTWIPEPNAKDQWRTISRLRNEAEAVLKVKHLSEEALTSHREGNGFGH
jgi:Ion channel